MPRTVLIIEDDEDTRRVYEDALVQRGYRVLTATNGAEGVHLARRNRPDLILLDIRMPVMDGWDTLLYLKSLRETDRIPVCAISAYEPEEEERARIGTLDFDRFLIKPVAPAAVVEAVEALIGGPDGVIPPVDAPDPIG